MNKQQFIWNGEKNRKFALCRPCSCGCDFREGKKGVGYLTGSNKRGKGFTVWIENEKLFKLLREGMER